MTRTPTAPGAPSAATADSPTGSVLDVIHRGEVRSVFQPIVDLDTGRVVGYEALARGPEGPLSSPAALFAAAREIGSLAELDEACRAAAFRGAAQQRLLSPLTVFVNVEPEVLETAPVEELLAIAAAAPGELRIVMEITERALASRPAELLQTVQRVRDLGWAVALDDVGADAASLAFMPFVRPDVVKLDLALVQDRPGPAVAEIMNAVNAYAERTGALILAEGIETPHHLAAARGLGASLGQGWLFGRPQEVPDPASGVLALHLPTREPAAPRAAITSPFSVLPTGTVLRRASKRLLVEVSKQLEREAMRLGETCVVASTFQHGRHFTPSTAQRYRDLVERTGFVCALGEQLPDEPVPGLRGAVLRADDPAIGEWDVVVVGPHFSAALLARDLGDTGSDMNRTFEYALTYDRDTVVEAARDLLLRVAPQLPSPATLPPAEAAPGAATDPLPRAAADPLPRAAGQRGYVPWRPGNVVVDQALEATPNGVSISDLTRPDEPLVFVNQSFGRLAGFPVEEVVGRNCRFLQGPDTDQAAVTRIRAAIAAGRSCTETLLNYRGPQREEWWNELHLQPVADEHGRVVQYLGIQSDVTARVRAERALREETDRSRDYLARIEQLAYTDHLTGLINRRRVEELVELELWEARAGGHAMALLLLDLDGFKQVNDRWSHAAGDELLRVVSRRVLNAVRRSDLVARLSADEFLVAVTGLDRGHAAARAADIATVLSEAVALPALVADHEVSITASIGVSTYPHDGEDVATLLHQADLRMYDAKRRSRSGR